VAQKTREHIYEDKLNYKCPFTKIFGALITKTSTGIFSFPPHLFSAATLPWELSRPKYHEFSIKLVIFPMLQY